MPRATFILALVAFVGLVAVVASPAFAAPQASSEPPRFPAQIEQVTVDVVVVDREGHALSGLTASDFTILEDGVAQSIVGFEAVQVPAARRAAAAGVSPPARPHAVTNVEPVAQAGRSFVIVFDNVHMTPGSAASAKRAITDFLGQGVADGDRVTLVATGGNVWWSVRMPAGREELVALLQRIEGRSLPDTSPDRMSDYEAMRIYVDNDTEVSDAVHRRFEKLGLILKEQDEFPGSSELRDPYIWSRAAQVYAEATAWACCNAWWTRWPPRRDASR